MKGTWQSGVGALALVGSGTALADYAYNLQTPASGVAQDVFQLHNLIMLVCLGIFVVVFTAMFYSLWKHRKSVGHQAAHFHENTTVEVIWTVIPFIILVGMAYPAARVVIDMKDTSSPDMTVKVTGFQWKWRYDYLNDGIGFYSNLSTPRQQIDGTAVKGEHYLLEVDEPMVVPVGKRVRLLVTANDVIHSWWLPAFSVKQDGIPGFIRDSWFKADQIGTYRGQCAELCGKEHGFMPIVVEVVSEPDYQAWVAKKKGAAQTAAADHGRIFEIAELMARGEKAYQANCAACHQENGMGLPGTFPAIRGSRVATGPIADHIKVVMNGRPGTAMAAFGPRLSDADIAAVVTYQRNAWGNKMGDLAQPAEIAATRLRVAKASATQ
ncbi:MAG: cytochrome c oxidase subunit II [Thiobacillus sp.]|jgi:cytochrome c oxidase subunit 2|uniref:cytochrome c oxidase subunit II n=1 Tax=Thiobacillus sp. TaxID=924 RepID=UPI0028955527|nr:cytochrome c oxidase subunit II [Thiobacillus sp.]MDT3706844.1 cytochrome c oxidase subunit II [Thiobacillus sp.]